MRARRIIKTVRKSDGTEEIEDSVDVEVGTQEEMDKVIKSMVNAQKTRRISNTKKNPVKYLSSQNKQQWLPYMQQPLPMTAMGYPGYYQLPVIMYQRNDGMRNVTKGQIVIIREDGEENWKLLPEPIE